MFNFLVNASLRNRLFVLAAAALLVVYGSFVLKDLPIDVFPDLNKPTVTLMTEAEGLAPEEVEQMVTFPIETSMNGMPGITRVRSVSGVGLSIVFVEFDWGTDIYRNRQQVAERLSIVQGQLPPNVRPQMGPISSIMGEIMLIALSSDKGSGDGISPMEVREIADWAVRPRLLAIPGVSQVIPIGGEIRQYRIASDPALMHDLEITTDELVGALRQFSANTGGGFIDQHTQEYLIRNIGRTTRLEDLRNLVVAYKAGPPLLLHQIAAVDFAARVKRGDAGVNGKPAVILSVQKQPGADTTRLTAEVEKALGDLTPFLPKGIQADEILFRQAN